MTTYLPIGPAFKGPYSFQAMLDDSQYTAVITWPVVSRRPYITLYDSNNDVVVNKALVGSADHLPIQTISWAYGVAFATTAAPHGLKIGTVIQIVIDTSVQPAGFQGTFYCCITGPNTFTYLLPIAPGPMTAPGAYGCDVNLVWGYVDTSTLVYRVSSNQLEINP